MKHQRHIRIRHDTGSFDGILLAADAQTACVQEARSPKTRPAYIGRLKINERGDYYVDIDERSSIFVLASDVEKALNAGVTE